MLTLGQRLKTIRQALQLSQEALGAQGFVSTPGWIKVENGQRHASDDLIAKFVQWLVREKHLAATDAARLQEELMTLKYAHHRSGFVRDLARRHHSANQASWEPVEIVPRQAGAVSLQVEAAVC